MRRVELCFQAIVIPSDVRKLNRMRIWRNKWKSYLFEGLISNKIFFCFWQLPFNYQRAIT